MTTPSPLQPQPQPQPRPAQPDRAILAHNSEQQIAVTVRTNTGQCEILLDMSPEEFLTGISLDVIEGEKRTSILSFPFTLDESSFVRVGYPDPIPAENIPE